MLGIWFRNDFESASIDGDQRVTKRKFLFVSENYFEHDLKTIIRLCRLELWVAKQSQEENLNIRLPSYFFQVIWILFKLLTDTLYILQNLPEEMKTQWVID